ncbi:MAG: DUF1829 domain-containing protein [Fretibacterium sp.]|nr:DUF1829 domain-containing protein [Fretibacterium sp.]
MLVNDLKGLLDEYVSWLKNKTVLNEIDNDWVEIVTPSLDSHNDYLQIYVRRDGSNYLLTDDGYVINDLLMSGCSLDGTRRATLLKQTLMGFGVTREGDALTVRASRADFPLKKHNLLQAMLSVGDLFFTHSPQTPNLFWDEVIEWLEMNEVRYASRIKLPGRSGYDHMFDFLIPKSKKEPERLIQTVNAPDKGKISDVLFKWEDTREMRSSGTVFYVILNDKDKGLPSSALTALKNYSLTPIRWSGIDSFKEHLIA